MCNSKTERLKEELSDHGIEAIYPTFYEREHDGEMSDGGGFIVTFFAIDYDADASESCEDRINRVCHDLYYREGCGCSHDCCGCVFTSSFKVTLNDARNFYADPHLKHKPAFDVVVKLGYGLNY